MRVSVAATTRVQPPAVDPAAVSSIVLPFRVPEPLINVTDPGIGTLA